MENTIKIERKKFNIVSTAEKYANFKIKEGRYLYNETQSSLLLLLLLLLSHSDLTVCQKLGVTYKALLLWKNLSNHTSRIEYYCYYSFMDENIGHRLGRG